jgi:hypothetical protein
LVSCRTLFRAKGIDMFAAMKSVRDSHEQSERCTDFVKMAALYACSGGSWHDAHERAAALGMPDRIVAQLKAATNATASGSVAATSLGPSVGAFVASLANIGAAERIAAASLRLPSGLYGRFILGGGVTVGPVNEAQAVPVRTMALSSTDVTPTQVSAIVAITEELLLAMGDEALRAFGNLLRINAAVGTDTALFAALVGNSAEAQGVDRTWQGLVDDFDEGLRQLALGAGSRPFIILTAENAKSIAAQAYANGITTLAWNGGSFAGAEILVSDAQISDRATFIDAASMAIALGDIELRSSNEAAYQSDSAPTMNASTPTPTAVVSAFQTGTTLLMVMRRVAFKAIRPNAYFHLTSLGLGEDSGSPAVG